MALVSGRPARNPPPKKLMRLFRPDPILPTPLLDHAELLLTKVPPGEEKWTLAVERFKVDPRTPGEHPGVHAFLQHYIKSVDGESVRQRWVSEGVARRGGIISGRDMPGFITLLVRSQNFCDPEVLPLMLLTRVTTQVQKEGTSASVVLWLMLEQMFEEGEVQGAIFEEIPGCGYNCVSTGLMCSDHMLAPYDDVFAKFSDSAILDDRDALDDLSNPEKRDWWGDVLEAVLTKLSLLDV